MLFVQKILLPRASQLPMLRDLIFIVSRQRSPLCSAHDRLPVVCLADRSVARLASIMSSVITTPRSPVTMASRERTASCRHPASMHVWRHPRDGQTPFGDVCSHPGRCRLEAGSRPNNIFLLRATPAAAGDGTNCVRSIGNRDIADGFCATGFCPPPVPCPAADTLGFPRLGAADRLGPRRPRLGPLARLPFPVLPLAALCRHLAAAW
jgi:hypothetical protein